MMVVQEPRTRLFSRDEYYSMAEMGWFGESRVERIEGEIIEMSPPLSLHAHAACVLNHFFSNRVPAGYLVRVKSPLSLGLNSDPQPDIAIVKGTFTDFEHQHPDRAELVIE